MTDQNMCKHFRHQKHKTDFYSACGMCVHHTAIITHQYAEHIRNENSPDTCQHEMKFTDIF